MARKIIRDWIPDGEGFDFPPLVINTIHEILDAYYPNWWGEVEFEEDGEFYQNTGDILYRIWLEKKDYDEHYPSDFSFVVGRWAYHKRFGGAWYYYDPSAIRRKLQEALEGLKEVEA